MFSDMCDVLHVTVCDVLRVIWHGLVSVTRCDNCVFCKHAWKVNSHIFYDTCCMTDCDNDTFYDA